MAFFLLLFLVFAILPTPAASQDWPVITADDGITVDGGTFLACPDGKFLFQERPIEKTEGYEALFASVLVRGDGLKSETHLFTRADGWTHLSSEKTIIMPLNTVSNCLPAGNYEVRIEYYTRVQYVGDWLVGVLEYPLTLNQTILDDDTLIISGIFGVYRDATLRDNLVLNWPLFLVYLVSIVLFITTLIVLIRTLRRRRKG